MENKGVLKIYISYYAVTLVAMVLEYVGGFIDNVVGGRLLGNEAFSSLSVAVPISLLFSMTGNCLMGGSILASQELGAGNTANARSYYKRTVLLTVSASLVLTVLIISFSDGICRLLCRNASEAVIQYGRDYLIWFTPSAIPILMIYVLSGFARLDNAKTIPMISTIVITVSDIALDMLLTPVWGIRGLAAATTISYILGFMTFILYFTRKDRIFRFTENTGDRISSGQLLVTGAPVAMNRLGHFINSAFLNYMAFTLASVAGGIVINTRSQCMNISLAIIFSVIHAGVPALGQYYGEQNGSKIKEMSKLMILSALIHAAILSCVCIFCRHLIPAVFGVEGGSVAGRACAFAIAWFGADLILKSVITAAMIIYQVTGRAKLSNVIAALETVLLIIPLELAFGMKLGINGLWIGALVSDMILVIIICCLYYSQHKGEASI